MHYTVIANYVANPTVKLLMLGAFLVLGLDAFRATVAFVVAQVAAGGLLVYFLNRQFSLRRPLGGVRRTLKEVLRYSVPMQLSQMVDQYNRDFQVLVLGAVQAASSVGIYSVTSQVNLLGKMVQSAVHTAASPLIAELHDQKSRRRLGHLYQTASKWSLTFSLPWFMVLMLVPEQILSLFGDSFIAGADALRILSLGTLANTATGICGGMLDMTGHSRLRLVNSVVSAVVMLGLSVALIPPMGVLGAAWAFVAGTAIVNLMRLVQVYRLVGLLPYNSDYAKPIGASLAAFAIALLVRQLVGDQASLVQGVAEVGVFALAYAIAIVASGLTAEDRLLLAPILRRVRLR
jgi:O-antigen/teichoic acid export membrane protein